MMNVLNGGAHADNNMEIQEFMIVPVGASCFAQALRWGSEIYHALGGLLRDAGHTTAVGDEGGYAPELESDEEAIRFLLRAIEAAGRTTDEVKISLDAAATEWAVPGRDGAFSYRLPKSGKERTPDELIRQWSDWSERYPLLSIEDGLGEQDFRSWADMTRRSWRACHAGRGRPVRHQCGSPARGHPRRRCQCHPYQTQSIGTLTETLRVIREARTAGYNRYILSHRSGETEDTTIADRQSLSELRSSNRGRPAVPNALPNTIGCCVLRRHWGRANLDCKNRELSQGTVQETLIS